MGKDTKKKNKAKAVYKKKYSQKNVNDALKEIEKGMSTRKAADAFQVPRSTLYAKQKKIIPVEGVKGPNTYLTAEEEKLLVDWIFYCSERGFPVSKSQLLQCVQKLITELERKTPFKDNKPGRHWWESFCHRHPDVTPRIAQNLTMNRASATEDVLKNWFNEVKKHLEKLNLLYIHPSRVFNLDESAFFLIPKADSVLARKGSLSVYKVVHGDEKESITVLFTVNAEGTMLPPMILFWYERTPAIVTNSLPPGWIAGNTEKGWMTADSFYNYITTKFYSWLVKNNIQFPVVLYVDGHASHLTLALSQFCKANQIELIALYPNATHILQPLDVAVFHPLKSKWKKTVDEWRIDHGAEKLKKEKFAPLLKQALDSMPNLTNIIKHGFQTCGLSPFSSDAVDFNVFNKKKKKIAESTECVDQDLTDSNEQKEATKHLKYFEHRLSSDDLQDFKNALSSGSLKISNSANEGLFKYWLDMKRLSGENVSNNVSTNEKDSRVDKSEMSIEVVNSTSCPVISDMNVDISQLEIVFLSEENENILIPETETLSTARGDVNTSKICDPTCRADIEPFEDLGQHDFSEVDKNVENKMKCDTKKLEDSNFNEQILNVTAIESNVTVHEKIINEVENNEKVLEELKENLNYNKPVLNISAIEELKNNNDQANDKTHQDIDVECNKEIPAPFKKALIWPEKIKKKKKIGLSKKVSTVLTSEEWQQHHLKIQEEKLRKQREVEDRKKRREEAKKRKVEEMEAKRAAAEEKKKLDEEIKKLLEKKKLLNIKKESL